MTTVIFEDTGKGRHISISGHSGYPGMDKGSNILCSAISVLSQSYLQVLHEMSERGEIKDFSYSLKSGDIQVYFTPPKDELVASRYCALERFLYVGFRGLESKYPENITVRLSGV